MVGGGGGRPSEAPGGHSGHLPRTDFGPFRKSSLIPTPPGPPKLRLFGEVKEVLNAAYVKIFNTK